MSRLAALLLACVLLLVAAPAEAAPPGYDIRGSWEAVAAASAFSGTITIDRNDCATGAFSGSAAAGGSTFPVTGRVDGTSVSLTITFSSEAGDSASATGAFVDGSRITGTFRDSGQFKTSPGDFQLVRRSGPPDDGACPLKRPTSVRVSCDYNVATAIDTCTTTVADATATPTTPTGTVAYKATQGVFLAGDSCDLRSTAAAPATASCSVQYRGPSGPRVFPDITAKYSGDATHAENGAKTQYLPLGGPLEYETPAPGTLEVGTDAPVDGTKVEACAFVSAGGAASAARGGGPMDFADIAAALKKAQSVIGTGTPAQTSTALKTLDDVLARAAALNQQTDARIEHLKGSTSATDVQELAALQRQQTQLFAAISAMTKRLQDMCRTASANVRSAVTAAKRMRALRIGYAPRRTAKRGPLTLKLKLSKAGLRRAARGRKRVTVYVWVDEVLPSALVKRGWPRATMQKVVLTRDGKLAG